VIAGARATAGAASLDLAAARLALAGSVVQTYLDLARAEAQGRIARRTIETRERSSRLTDVRIRNQLASDLDREASATLLAQARQALLRARAAQVLGHNALAALAGRGPDYAATIGTTAVRLDAALPMPSVIPADLFSRRADIAGSADCPSISARGRPHILGPFRRRMQNVAVWI
jgi:outer membrane protein TolC